MKKLLVLLCLFFPADLSAQAELGAKLSPYEENRYGGSLWEVPREPYQSRYQNERFNSKLYQLPESTVRERFQNRLEWESEQHRISERAGQGYRPPNK